MPNLQSEQVIISSPLSFAGSAQRIWKMTSSDNNVIRWLLLVPIAVLLILTIWSIVVVWYVIIFGLFGIFVIPFRLWRRSVRKTKRDEIRHRELLEQIHSRAKL